MNVEWTITGMILLGAMTAGGISLYLKRRKTRDFDLLGDNPDPEKYQQDKK
jgi:hypothetical protein